MPAYPGPELHISALRVPVLTLTFLDLGLIEEHSVCPGEVSRTVVLKLKMLEYCLLDSVLTVLSCNMPTRQLRRTDPPRGTSRAS